MTETMTEKIERADISLKAKIAKEKREHPERYRKPEVIVLGAEQPEFPPEEGLSAPVDSLSQMGKEAAEKFEEAGRPMRGAKDD